ncbi:hypothetical protein [Aeoliella mucimassa]|uniref:Uncharacterized protein n=1 Tax=Aeoliella mucimassa TaxID=2527972 RepID=A0A518AQD2_9BACT|nr:hypothetical protein [Aeoliella mucimassa]QDU56930.1 hypothetical protein Pan181_31420 [Aeoliella mucimassa]
MKTSRQSIAVLCLVLLAAAASWNAGPAQAASQAAGSLDDVAIHAQVDKSTALVADPMEFVLEVTAPSGTQVRLPRLPDKLGELDVLSQTSVEDIPLGDGSNQRLWKLTALLESLRTGEQTIPSLDVQVATTARPETFYAMQSEPLVVTIASLLEDQTDPTKLHDVKDPVDIEIPSTNSGGQIVWWIVGAGVVGVAVLATTVLLMRKKTLSPAKWALLEIEDLQQLLAGPSVDGALVYNELVEIVRQYFELQYALPIRARTTPEFLSIAAQTMELPEHPAQRLESLMAIADNIKFARSEVELPALQQAFDDARGLIAECEQPMQAQPTGGQHVS